jgi:integrative and conjugative element protein (TIGR02256 family)
VIEEATGPRASDLRTRTLYVPDRAAEQAEIDFWHTRRLHYVGDWHTHPEQHPEPSGSDRESIRESFIRSRHSLRGFLMVIVGTAEFPNGLFVSLNDSDAGCDERDAGSSRPMNLAASEYGEEFATRPANRSRLMVSQNEFIKSKYRIWFERAIPLVSTIDS